MKVYFIDVLYEKTYIYLKTNEGTKKVTFNINGEKHHFINNSCRFCYDFEDIIFTPETLPFDDIHENIFNYDLSFVGHRYNIIEKLEKFVHYIVKLIDDSDYEIVFLLSSDIINFGVVGKVHLLIGEMLKFYSHLKYLGTLHHNALKHSALGFIASFNQDDYLFVDDNSYFSSTNKKYKISNKGEPRYEDSMSEFAHQMKYNLGVDDLTQQQINKIFFRAYHQYQKNHETDLTIKTKDREITVTVNEIESRFESGKERFKDFIQKNVSTKKYTCYLDIESPDIYLYTNTIINQSLNLVDIVIVDNMFYDYFYSYCLLIITYHNRAQGNLTRKKYHQKGRNVPFDGHHVYSLLELYHKDELLTNLPCCCLEQFIYSKKITA